MTLEGGKHIPNGPAFAFDAEVAQVFDDMAVRSIPGYEYAHAFVQNFVSDRYGERPSLSVWDMGTTTGRGLLTLHAALNRNPLVEYRGCEVSVPMLEKSRQVAKFATVEEHDLTKGLPAACTQGSVDVMLFMWVLQFITDLPTRRRLIAEAYQALAPGGALFVFEKYSRGYDRVGELQEQMYLHFRRGNGYSVEEIVAKTQSLKAAMITHSRDFIEGALEDAGFSASNIVPGYSLYNFGGYLALRG